MPVTQLDKSLDTSLAEGHGTITIRVVVLEKLLAASPATAAEVPADAEPDEILPDDDDKRPTASYLEQQKHGKQCCVFLINGQRQHTWDNAFIVRDLELKYLRNRMIVVVDCDGLRAYPESPLVVMHCRRETNARSATFRNGVPAWKRRRASPIPATSPTSSGNSLNS